MGGHGPTSVNQAGTAAGVVPEGQAGTRGSRTTIASSPPATAAPGVPRSLPPGDPCEDGVEEQRQQERGKEPEIRHPTGRDAALQERKMGDDDEGQRDGRPVPVQVQVGAHGENERAGAPSPCRRGRAAFGAADDGTDDQGEQERDADVGPVLGWRVEDDVPVGIAVGHEGVAQRGVAERELLIAGRDGETHGIDGDAGDRRRRLGGTGDVLGPVHGHVGPVPDADDDDDGGASGHGHEAPAVEGEVPARARRHRAITAAMPVMTTNDAKASVET